jgi:hypothetical protein
MQQLSFRAVAQKIAASLSCSAAYDEENTFVVIAPFALFALFAAFALFEEVLRISTRSLKEVSSLLLNMSVSLLIVVALSAQNASSIRFDPIVDSFT